MDAQLFHDTMNMLRNEVDAEAAVRLDISEQSMQDMLMLLYSCRIARKRKVTILGCYILLYLAIHKHRELNPEDGAKTLARCILDGDYFFGLFFRWLMKCKETELLQVFAPIHKKLQIGILNGHYPEQLFQDVFERIRAYLGEPYLTVRR